MNKGYWNENKNTHEINRWLEIVKEKHYFEDFMSDYN